MLGIAYRDFAYLPASDTRGGILIAGHHPDVVLSDVLIGCYSVTVAVTLSSQVADPSAEWWLTVVYGPQDDGAKVLFLEELEAVRDACAGPWMLTGDFNLILNEADKNNECIDRANLRRFRRTVAGLQLQDLHLHGRTYTWSNERETPTLVRLDKVLVSVDWEEKFPNSHLRGLGSNASDHCALLLQTNLGRMSKARFHFEVFWPKFHDYDSMLVASWQRQVEAPDPLARFDAMLRNLVRELQRWSSTKIGDIKAQLLMARELVLRLDNT